MLKTIDSWSPTSAANASLSPPLARRSVSSDSPTSVSSALIRKVYTCVFRKRLRGGRWSSLSRRLRRRRGRRGGGGGGWHDRDRVSLVAGPAGHGLAVLVHFRDVGLIDRAGHPQHGPRDVLLRLGIAGELELLLRSRRVGHVAVVAARAEA